ncbi:hypothetical protein HOP60_09810 [Halomonas daqingensis]|uniref:SinR-like protein n=1 Tax=Billgrantia desiderata TaxID=52021 RepID=A0ABS9B575_9GAMM|nr:CRISPR-associated protein Cas2 [Halomonas desiderata]MCE8042448.1 hypothetical protein [Halomonas desiderata]MCE8047023.1 hypothetical protein [Halomonas desiderata]
MANYIVAYDLHTPGQDYKSLREAFEAYGYYYKPLRSTWLIKTTQSSEQIRNNLMRVLDSNDKLIVLKLSGEAAWTNGFDNDWLQGFLNSP